MSLRSKLKQIGMAQLSQIQVASPCQMPWEQMEGDEKVRFCQECRLHVYNLSAMDVEEAAERISQDDDRLCVRFYRRTDGTILTQDCPVGRERRGQKRRQLVQNAAAALVGGSLAGMLLMPTMGGVVRPAARIATLHSAAASNNVTALRSLLDAGVHPDARVKGGPTALMRAAASGQVQAVRLLLARGADVNARDQDGTTALQYAREAQLPSMVKLLKKAGAVE